MAGGMMKIRALEFYKNDPRTAKDRWNTFLYYDLFPVRKWSTVHYLKWRIKRNERKIARLERILYGGNV